jgi:hypothetical protein
MLFDQYNILPFQLITFTGLTPRATALYKAAYRWRWDSNRILGIGDATEAGPAKPAFEKTA